MKEYKIRMNKMIKNINKMKNNKNSLNNKQIENLNNSYSNKKIHKRNHTSGDIFNTFNKNSYILKTDFTNSNKILNINKLNSNSYRSNSNNKIKNTNVILNNFNCQDKLFSIKLMEKKIKYFKFKKHFYQSLLYYEIPNNKIYNTLLNLIEIKKNEFNSINNIKNNNMNIIPVQSKFFRNDFMELLFKNKDLLNAINKGEKSYINEVFNKRLFSK